MAKFEIGNKAAEKWTEEEAIKAFESMLEYATSHNDVLSVQQAYIDFGMPCATYYYLIDKHPVLETIKKGINDLLISRINKGSLVGDYISTPAIWRMKQLGEKDTQHQEINSNVTQTNIISLGSGKKPK